MISKRHELQLQQLQQLQKWLNGHTIYHFPFHPFEEYTKMRKEHLIYPMPHIIRRSPTKYNERFAGLLFIFTNNSNKSSRTMYNNFNNSRRYKIQIINRCSRDMPSRIDIFIWRFAQWLI